MLFSFLSLSVKQIYSFHVTMDVIDWNHSRSCIISKRSHLFPLKTLAMFFFFPCFHSGVNEASPTIINHYYKRWLFLTNTKVVNCHFFPSDISRLSALKWLMSVSLKALSGQCKWSPIAWNVAPPYLHGYIHYGRSCIHNAAHTAGLYADGAEINYMQILFCHFYAL